MCISLFLSTQPASGAASFEERLHNQSLDQIFTQTFGLPPRSGARWFSCAAGLGRSTLENLL